MNELSVDVFVFALLPHSSSISKELQATDASAIYLNLQFKQSD